MLRQCGRLALAVAVVGLLAGCGASASADRMSAPGVAPGGAQDAGYFRAQLYSGAVPKSSDITVEGFLGEHDIQYPEATCDQVLCMHALVGNDEAVAEGGSATFIALAMATAVDLSARPRLPVNMAVVVDVSGSMAEAGKLDYVKQGLLTMVAELGPEDRLALVTYSTTARVVEASRLVDDRAVFEEAINALQPNGSTNLYDGMVLGYEQVLANASAYSLPRVMLLSDGLANTGISDSAQIVSKSASYNDQGIGITTVGVGLDFNQTLMRTLAEQGGGNFYFIENPAKVTAVFKDELDFLVTPLANDLQVTLALAPGIDMVETYGIAFTHNDLGELVLRVPTVFASSQGGAMLVRIDSTDGLAAHAGEVVTSVHYSYRPIADDGTAQESTGAVTDARMVSLTEPSSRAYESKGVLKAIVLWNMVTSFQAASDIYHETYDRGAALEVIQALATYVDDANVVLADEEIAKDRVELVNQLAINLGGYIGDSTWGGRCIEGSAPDGSCRDGLDPHYRAQPMYCAAAVGDKVPLMLVGLVLFGLLRVRQMSYKKGEGGY
ncbi:MAG: VWA domain-containing protein [Deltaproteobacteria bacterium]|nr:VWA domain-containing protein [Deltaproteobacteria bacterium]